MPKSTCSIPECQNPVLARGWCRMHYQRWHKYGDPLETLYPLRVNGSIEKRFWAKVSPADNAGCLMWIGAKHRGGYGVFSPQGSSTKLAHIIAYEMQYGPVSDGLELDHNCHTRDLSCPGGVTCRHRLCVNAEHIEPVTHRENVLRGRGFAAVNAAKTHCPNNHPYDAENTYISKEGYRGCKECGRARYRSGK